MSDARDLNDPLLQPSPLGGWSESIVHLEDAYVVPPKERSFVQPAGILDRHGDYCPQGALWRRTRPITTKPDRPDTAKKLKGRWLWGGVLWKNFGHFLVESTARLWAADYRFDGILFVPKSPSNGETLATFQQAFVDQLVPIMPIRVATEPLQVESLTVPGQGFGLGGITVGTNAFRQAFRSRFAIGLKPEGPEKIYLSRSALGLGKGGILGEERLEELLVANGYEIFHPQQHDLPTQLARYKAAKQVIAADGSALHLFAFVARADQRVAMISRRLSTANDLLTRHVGSFSGSEPVTVNALRTEWVRASRGKSDRLSFGELDHAKVGKILEKEGFVSDGSSWQLLTDGERKTLFDARGMSGSSKFIESPATKRERIRVMRQDRRRLRAEGQVD